MWKRLLLLITLFIMPVGAVYGLTCERTYYNPTSWRVIQGNVTYGTLLDLRVQDGANITVSETGSFVIYFNFTIPEESFAVDYSLYALYTGNAAHNVSLESYNWNTNTWVSLTTIKDAVAFSWYNVSVSNWSDAELFSQDTTMLRIIHYSPSNPLHEIDLDYLQAMAWVPTEPYMYWFLPVVVGVVFVIGIKHIT